MKTNKVSFQMNEVHQSYWNNWWTSYGFRI